MIFHWTTWLPMRLEGRTVIIEGRRATARFELPAGTEARLEHLPLLSARRRAIDEQRREIVQFGLAYAETQPRLTVHQAGRSGIFRITVKLELKK